jgi:hypothetical protein
MQITLDLPDEAFALADALAKQESRSLGSVIAGFILGRPQGIRRTSTQSREPQPTPGDWKMPVLECHRTFTSEDVARWEAEDDSL